MCLQQARVSAAPPPASLTRDQAQEWRRDMCHKTLRFRVPPTIIRPSFLTSHSLTETDRDKPTRIFSEPSFLSLFHQHNHQNSEKGVFVFRAPPALLPVSHLCICECPSQCSIRSTQNIPFSEYTQKSSELTTTFFLLFLHLSLLQQYKDEHFRYPISFRKSRKRYTGIDIYLLSLLRKRYSENCYC